jgi:hypothetical protein
MHSFSTLRAAQPQTGFVRVDRVVDYKAYASILDTNRVLRDQVQTLQSELEKQRKPDHAKDEVQLSQTDLPSHLRREMVITTSYDVIFEGEPPTTLGKKLEFRVSVGELFHLLSQYLISDNTESYILKRLSTHFQALVRQKVSLDDSVRLSVGRNVIDEDSVQMIRETMYGLGLIDIRHQHEYMGSTRTKEDLKLVERYWNITFLGQRDFSLLTTVYRRRAEG